VRFKISFLGGRGTGVLKNQVGKLVTLQYKNLQIDFAVGLNVLEFGIVTAVEMSVFVFWVVTPC
jgi:hypothetical protein